MNEIDKKNELLGRISQINAVNSISIYLRKNTATLNLFDEIQYFNSNEKKFLIFENTVCAYIGDKSVRLSLVVSSGSLLYHKKPAFSMSYLKSVVPIIMHVNTPERYKDEKFYQLVFCINEAIPEMPNSGEIIVFKTPCMLKAQTNDDRSGFGNEWAGRGSYSIGKQYGEARTPFAIVGVIVK